MMKSLRGHMKGGGAEQGSMCDSADAKVIDNPPREAELRLNLVSSSCIMPGCHGYPSSSYKKIRGVGRGCVGGGIFSSSSISFDMLWRSFPGGLRVGSADLPVKHWIYEKKINKKIKMVGKQQWWKASSSNTNSSPRTPPAMHKCVWADYHCKLIFIPVRTTNFHFQHIITECMPEVALMSAVLFAIMTSSGFQWRQTRLGLNLFGEMSGWCKGSPTRALALCFFSICKKGKYHHLCIYPPPPSSSCQWHQAYTWRQKVIFLFTGLQL